MAVGFPFLYKYKSAVAVWLFLMLTVLEMVADSRTVVVIMVGFLVESVLLSFNETCEYADSQPAFVAVANKFDELKMFCCSAVVKLQAPRLFTQTTCPGECATVSNVLTPV